MKTPVLILSFIGAFGASALAHAYSPPTGVEFLPDIAYRNEHEKQKLDILRPANRPDRLPAILLVDGGGSTSSLSLW